MQCRQCDYLLFNLPRPVCPECGTPFDTEAYRFDLGAVSFNCPQCDQSYYGNDARGLPWPRRFTCVQCQRPVSLQELRVVPQRPDAFGYPLGESPWDRRQELGFVRAWWDTFKMTLARPGEFFRSHQGTSSGDAWIFAVTSMYIGFVPLMLVQFLIMIAITGFVSGVAAGGVGAPAVPPIGLPMVGMALIYGIGALVYPLAIPFIAGGLSALTIQLALLVLAPNRKSLGHTFRAAQFSYGPFALCAVPICGAYVAGVWQIVTLIIGVKEVHGISGWRAAFAVLWPVACLAVIYLMVVVALLAGVFG